MRTEEGCEDGTARAWRRLEGRPATQEVAEDRGVCLLQPLEHRWNIVLEGTGQAVGAPHCVTDHTATVRNELGEGAHGGARWPARLQLVAMGEQPCTLEGSVRGGVCGPNGRAGVAIPRQPQGMDGEEDQKVIRAQGRAQRACGEFETNGLGGVLELAGCT